MPSSSTKIPPAAKTWRWWSEYRAKRAVVGVSLSPLWSPFLRGLNSSSRNTSHTTKFLQASVLKIWFGNKKWAFTLQIGRRRKRIFPFWFRWVCLVCKSCRSNRHAKSFFLQCDAVTFLLDHFNEKAARQIRPSIVLTEKYQYRPDHFAKKLRREKMIANISGTECKSSISVSLLGRRQCDFTVFYYLRAVWEKQKWILESWIQNEIYKMERKVFLLYNVHGLCIQPPRPQ